MKTICYNVDGKVLKITLRGEDASVAEVKLDGKPLSVSPEEMQRYAAVISLALIEDETIEVHDEEEGRITLNSQLSSWADVGDMFNRLQSL
ncbi:MAG: hypothetical protein IJT13_00860 [Bacteroidaceae bacterium]|nr:hypothetical protein [Bacteroidaceae bacterium]